MKMHLRKTGAKVEKRKMNNDNNQRNKYNGKIIMIKCIVTRRAKDLLVVLLKRLGDVVMLARFEGDEYPAALREAPYVEEEEPVEEE